MRTNISINDDIMAECLQVSGLKTKKEVVERALLYFLQINKQAKIKLYRGKLAWNGNLDKERTQK